MHAVNLRQTCHPGRGRRTCCLLDAAAFSAALPAANLSDPTHTGTSARCAMSTGSSPNRTVSEPSTNSTPLPLRPYSTREHIHVPPACLQHLRQRNHHGSLSSPARRQAAHAHHRPLQPLPGSPHKDSFTASTARYTEVERPRPRPARAHGFTNLTITSTVRFVAPCCSSKTLRPRSPHGPSFPPIFSHTPRLQ